MEKLRIGQTTFSVTAVSSKRTVLGATVQVVWRSTREHSITRIVLAVDHVEMNKNVKRTTVFECPLPSEQ